MRYIAIVWMRRWMIAVNYIICLQLRLNRLFLFVSYRTKYRPTFVRGCTRSKIDGFEYYHRRPKGQTCGLFWPRNPNFKVSTKLYLQLYFGCKIQFAIVPMSIVSRLRTEYKLNFYRTEWKSELDRERKWRIKVTQIPCDCRDREDPDMKLAPSGTVLQIPSFNATCLRDDAF